MADTSKKNAPKAAKAKKPKGPKFAARFVRDGEVLKIRTRYKHHSNSYEVEVLHFPKGDTAPGGKGTRADNDLIAATAYPTFVEAQTAAQAEVEKAKAKGFEPRERTGKRTPLGWDTL